MRNQPFLTISLLKKALVWLGALGLSYGVIFSLPFFVDPRLSRFEESHRLWNWDLKNHAQGDFDQDGNEDLITFTGCAFFSRVQVEDIPAAQQCTATGIARLTLLNDNQVGQKYITTSRFDLNLNTSDPDFTVTHSYLGKNSDQNWRIFVNSKEGLHAYEVLPNGVLEKGENITFLNRLDEQLYTLSTFFIVLALPFVVLMFIFSNPIEITLGIVLALIVILLLQKKKKVGPRLD